MTRGDARSVQHPALRDCVIVVTGADRGIGLAIAKRFAQSGARLALNHFGESSNLGAVVEETERLGGEACLVQADISDRYEAQHLIEAAERRFGQIDVLVNNAGVLTAAAIGDTTWDIWDRMINTNLAGTFACMRSALPGMVTRGSGKVINVASELGLIGYPDYAAYCASKGGVIALSKAVAKEVAPKGVLVNCVAPGPVITDMLVNDTTEYNEEARVRIPLQRFGHPTEIADVVEFLAGPGGSFFVGQVISPNGGTAI